jgi:hypothetical protein
VFSDEPFKARRQPVEHSLAVADVVVILRQLERQGLVIHAVQTEPDCHIRLGGVDLKPDLYIDMDSRGRRMRIFLEADMATQGRKRIMQKFGLYIAARGRLSEAEYQAWNPWPTVLFIAVDEERRRELNYLLRDVGEDDRRMFTVTTRDALPGLLTGQR